MPAITEENMSSGIFLMLLDNVHDVKLEQLLNIPTPNEVTLSGIV
jgi:hypothetical protein